MDFSTMEEADLRDLLASLGIDDVELMDHESLLATAASLSSMEDNTTQESTQTSSSTITSRIPAAYDFENSGLMDEIQTRHFNPTYSQSSYSELESSQLSPSLSPQQTTSVETDSVNRASNNVLMEKVKLLQDIAGVDENTATYLLEACAFNVDDAAALHFSDVSFVKPNSRSTSISSAEYRRTEPPAAGSISDVLDYGHLDAPSLPANSGRHGPRSFNPADFVPPSHPLHQQLQQALRRTQRQVEAGGLRSDVGVSDHTFGQDDDNDMDDDAEYGDYEGGSGTKKSKVDDEYQENFGVRRPDPIRKQRLVNDGPSREIYGISGMGVHAGSTRGALEPASVDWMFPPPRQLSYQGSFEEAKLLGKSDKKWILVNLQNHALFESQMLNRDTWTDETVESIIRQNFIFWQRGNLSEDGRQYLRLYGLDETLDLPHIAIIDSRTGAKLTQIKGYMSPASLTAALVEFLDENQLESAAPPRSRQLQPTMRHETMQYKNYSDNFDVPLEVTDDLDDLKPAGSSGPPWSSLSNSLDTSTAATTPVLAPTAVSGIASINEVASAVKPVPAKAVVDYGTPPVEPNADEAGTIRISLKLPAGNPGKPIVRRYRQSDTVRTLYAVAQAATNITSDFEILVAYPSRILNDLDATLEDAKLAGVQVIMRIK